MNDDESEGETDEETVDEDDGNAADTEDGDTDDGDDTEEETVDSEEEETEDEQAEDVDVQFDKIEEDEQNKWPEKNVQFKICLLYFSLKPASDLKNSCVYSP